jgi:hypothetical protein
MAAFLILATVLALSGLVSVVMAWGVLGAVLYVMQSRAMTPRPVVVTTSDTGSTRTGTR